MNPLRKSYIYLAIGMGAFSILQPAPAAASYRVVHGWPSLPEGTAFMDVPGVAVDSHNHVFVFHRGEQPVICLDGDTGKIIASWGKDLFKTEHGLEVDQHDNIWLTDVHHHQVFKFSHDGELIMVLGTQGVPGLDGNHFDGPTDVAVAPSGEFYVSDGYGNNRVAKFSAEGRFLLDWGRKGEEEGEFDLPHGIALDAEGRVYVADRSNLRIQVFDADGKFLHAWKSSELGRPWGLSVGSDDYLYVIDGGDLKSQPPDRGRVLKLDLEGRILAVWGSYGRYDGQFNWGHDVDVGTNGHVYVTDIKGKRIQKFVPE